MDNFYKRQIYIRIGITIIALLYIGQLAYLQLINTEYKRKGISISNHEVVKIAPRGLVYDRNGELLVNNTSNFALAVIPR
ncbi:MAG: penicillin-binding protein 2, partial [Bacteroidia bacterium]